MLFPKPRRGDIFIETIIIKTQSSVWSDIYNLLEKHFAPDGAKDFVCYLFL